MKVEGKAITAQENYLKLAAEFPGQLRVIKEQGRELYVDGEIDVIPRICAYLGKEQGYPLTALFAADERRLCGSYALYYVFALRSRGELLTIRTKVGQDNQFPSISSTVYAADRYEREIHDLFGLVPQGHPDLRPMVFHSNWPDHQFPLRKDFDGSKRPEWVERPMEFEQVLGEGVYEIPVGPVHAGIIEPGHFRFSVAGEPIIHLEAQLYFVHKGIEKLCEGESVERGLYMAERISGDETFANAMAYSQAIEKIAGMDPPSRAAYSRVLFAELERLTSHLGDLGGICLDVAYGFAAFQFRMMKGWAYQIADELCGMRFLRSVIQPGGLRRDFAAGKEAKVLKLLAQMKKELNDTLEIIRGNTLFIDRVEHTGVLSTKVATDLNAVGPGGRASGIHYDVRKSYPYAAYDRLSFKVPEHHNGDVNCRMNVKLEECLESIQLMTEALESMPAGPVWADVPSLEPYRFGIGLVEAPRGECLHWLMAGEKNTLFRYKIRTPSFCNWPALCQAVQGNIVPDFPLINKSFNLSYAGNDL